MSEAKTRKIKTRYSPAIVNAAAELAKAGADNDEIIGSLKISNATYYRWLSAHKGFRDAIADARLPSTLPDDLARLNQVKEEVWQWLIDGVRSRGQIVQEGDGLGSYTRSTPLPPMALVEKLRLLDTPETEQTFNITLTIQDPDPIDDDGGEAFNDSRENIETQ